MICVTFALPYLETGTEVASATRLLWVALGGRVGRCLYCVPALVSSAVYPRVVQRRNRRWFDSSSGWWDQLRTDRVPFALVHGALFQKLWKNKYYGMLGPERDWEKSWSRAFRPLITCCWALITCCRPLPYVIPWVHSDSSSYLSVNENALPIPVSFYLLCRGEMFFLVTPYHIQ